MNSGGVDLVKFILEFKKKVGMYTHTQTHTRHYKLTLQVTTSRHYVHSLQSESSLRLSALLKS